MQESAKLPTIQSLGNDLLYTSFNQKCWTLARPFVGLALFGLLYYLNLWYLLPLIVFYIFFAVVTSTHDVVHASLGLTKKQTEIWLFILGAILLESGHAYRLTHLNHHKKFPSDDDPEGEPAKVSTWKAILIGPTFIFKLYFWALKNAQNDTKQYYWIIAEGMWFIAVLLLSVITFNFTPVLLVYALLVLVGSWVYPLLTVHLPHYKFGLTPITQTRSLKGKIIPLIFLELTYHLEHHLYPQVPSHHLKLLSKKLNPWIENQGAKYWHVL